MVVADSSRYNLAIVVDIMTHLLMALPCLPLAYYFPYKVPNSLVMVLGTYRNKLDCY